MGAKQKKPLLELPVELRAYINQQISSLAPFCLPDSGVAVLVEEEIEDFKEIFTVTISLSGGDAEVYATGRADNIIDATKSATGTLVDHLTRVQRQMMSEMEEKDRSTSGDEDSGPTSEEYH